MNFRPLLLAALCATSAFAFDDVDVFLASQRVAPLPRALPELTAQKVRAGAVTNVEPRLGVPTFFFAPRDAQAPDLRAAGVTPVEAARRALFTYAPLYRQAPAALAEARVALVHDTGFGAVLVQFDHQVDGVPVFRDRLTAVMDPKLQLVALSGAFSPLPVPERRFELSPETALSVAWESATHTTLAPGAFVGRGLDAAGKQRFETPSLEHGGPSLARAWKVFFSDADARRLEPAWYVELESGALWSTIVSARDGRVLYRASLTQADSYGYNVWVDPATRRPLDGPQGRATPNPTAAYNGGYEPPFQAPAVITLENAGFSQNDPWLPPMATVTTGNNAEAFADLVGPDDYTAPPADGGVGDPRGTITAPGDFGDTYDVTQGPTGATQVNAGIAQLFYTVNWLHDVYYDRGFDEAAGNAQADNFGRGGAEGDSIRAQAQDFAGVNNANMSTPADGARPRMRMYVWTGPSSADLTLTPGGAVAVGTASFGPTSFDVTADVVLANDGVAPSVSDGCEALTNNVVGKVVLVDRGSCSFAIKTKNAQNAGAVGVLIANNAAGTTPPGLGGTDPTVTIGSFGITQGDGTALKTALLAGPVSAHLQRLTQPDRDGSIDNTVVAHEWGHYLAHRLSISLGSQQAAGMGEGWSDFVAMLMTVEEADKQLATNATFNGTYALAVWDTADAYFGIRRVPYSVDFTKNALTFRNIGDGNALAAAVPHLDFGSNSEVHNTGEVWATMLWECYVTLLRATGRMSFTEARGRMENYLVAHFLALPADPTFTEARDAMLAVTAANDLQDFQAFARSFAVRGLGSRAVSPPRDASNNLPLTEDFNTDDDVAFVDATLDDAAGWCDHDGVLDSGETGRLTIRLRNAGINDLAATTATITSSLPGVVITPATVSFPGSHPFQVVSGTTTLTLPALSSITDLDLTVAFTDPAVTAPGAHSQTVHVTVNKDDVPNSSLTDGFESEALVWTQGHDATLTPSQWERVADSALAHHVFGVDTASTSDFWLMSPPLQVGTGPFSFTYRNAWSFESDTTDWDGAVIELSTDDGATWNDIGAQATPGYNGFISSTTAGNPLSQRNAWSPASAGYPSLLTTTVNLGASYAGQTVRVRLRIGTDANSAAVGWDVDDFTVSGVVGLPFPSVVADRGLCVNRPPVANAGPDLSVDERTTVTLSSSASTDPDGDQLTATWTQTAGPTVTVTNGVFTAPEVTGDTTLTFSLVVSDGALTSQPDSLDVVVHNVNRAPIANAGPDQTVDENTQVTLSSAASSDPDGDAITATWTQTAGPTVTLTNGVFTAPDLTADVTLTFSLVVNDGALDSQPDLVDVHVVNSNSPPTLMPLVAMTVDERSMFSLVAMATDVDGNTLSYTWQQTSGPTAQQLNGHSASTLSLLAPEVTADTLLHFEVTVSDGLETATGGVDVTVKQVNRPPTAQPFGPAWADPGQTVQLTSTASDPDGDAVTLSWSQTAGPTVTLSDATTAAPTFVAPEVATNTDLTFQLVANDGQVDGAPAVVTVHVRGTNGTPVAEPGADVEVFAGESITLDGSRSHDPDGDTLRFHWQQEGEGSRLTLTDAETATPTVTAPLVTAQEKLTVVLYVRDPAGAVGNATVHVTVKVKEASGCGCAAVTGVEPMLLAMGLLLLRTRRRK